MFLWFVLFYIKSVVWVGVMVVSSVIVIIIGVWVGGGFVDWFGCVFVVLILGVVGGVVMVSILLFDVVGVFLNIGLIVCVVFGVVFDVFGMVV